MSILNIPASDLATPTWHRVRASLVQQLWASRLWLEQVGPYAEGAADHFARIKFIKALLEVDPRNDDYDMRPAAGAPTSPPKIEHVDPHDLV